LSSLVDQLAARLLVADAGAAPRGVLLAGTTYPTLRAYLAGQAAYRQGRYQEAVTRFDEALALDSTFAPAALGLVTAGEWPGVTYHGGRYRLAWALRERLSDRDRVILRMYLGPDYPVRRGGSQTQGARLADVRRALEVAPDRVEVWYLLGDVFLHWGATLGERAPAARAAAAFGRALELDSTFGPALDHLVQARMALGDTAATRRLAALSLARDSTSDNAEYLRWSVALTLGDSAAIAASRARFAAMPSAALTFIVGEGTRRGAALGEVERAAAVLRSRALTRDGRRAAEAVRNLALNRGRPVDVPAPGADPASSAEQQNRIAEALYWDGDPEAAEIAVRELSVGHEAPFAADAGGRERQVRERCVLEQWRIAHGDTRTARRTLAALRGLTMRADSATIDPATPLCISLLDALLAAAERRPDAHAAAVRLDTLLVRYGLFFADPPTYVYAGNLVVARLLGVHGDYARALAAVRRRPNQPLFAQWFLASYLREEGRLAALAGDRAGALRAYRHYLALRSDPGPRHRADAAQVAAEIARLERTSVRR
jgi:tetratricopeptide (TPR) repeat protein